MEPPAAQCLQLSCQSNNTDLPSQQLWGRYRILKRIGEGGVASVFLALDAASGNHVALKIARADNPDASDALRSEFCFAITHPHPLLVTPAGLVYENGLPIIIMPYVGGASSENNFPEKEKFLSRMSQESIENVIVDILEAGALINFAGYVYNDFKPTNLIFRQTSGADGAEKITPVLLDFNLVSREGQELLRRGTIEYVAPEVLLGRPPSLASDLYSIGATIYELLSGVPPFSAPESSQLIKIITEDGTPDFSSLPARLRDGVAGLLAREPSRRPADFRAAAALFHLDKAFERQYKSRAAYFLSAGVPPFADELKTTLREYISGDTEKALVIQGVACNYGDLNFVAAELCRSGYSVERIKSGQEESTTERVLDDLMSRAADPGRKIALLIENISGLSKDGVSKLRALVRKPRRVPVVAGARRWLHHDFPVFDLLKDHSHHSATEAVLSAFLKTDRIPFDYSALERATGGDPELLHLHLENAIASNQFDLLSPQPGFSYKAELTDRISASLAPMVSSLGRHERALLSRLSAWHGPIPLILLAEYNEGDKALIDDMIRSGHLQTSKEYVDFPSENARSYVYSLIPAGETKRLHRFWAEAAEKYLVDDELLEAAAYHWGLSDDSEKGFAANLAAAREFLKRGELSKAAVFAEKSLKFSSLADAEKSLALMTSADIQKQAGDYNSARRKYLELLKHLELINDDTLKCETYKDLGDLYRSMKKPRRALYYTQKALQLFQKLGDEQGLANCHNNIGLIHWVSQHYEEALSSFSAALEVNKRLQNFSEQAKILSNIGIIKDIMGKTDEVAGLFEEGLANAVKAFDPWSESMIENNLGYFYIRQNKLEKAQHHVQRALRISEKMGYTEKVINSLTNLGYCSLLAGNLFSSIDFHQRAMQMAEAIGNKHLAFDSQLSLAEVSVLMGNYQLADKALAAIEKDKAYDENRVLHCQVDLLRSWYHRMTGDAGKSLSLALGAASYAESVKDSRLRIESMLAIELVSRRGGDGGGLETLSRLADEAATLGHFDVADSAALGLARFLVDCGSLGAASGRVDVVLERGGQTTKLATEARVIQGEIHRLKAEYNEAITVLTENETLAAASGLIPLAMEAAVILAEVYYACGKISKGKEVLARAGAYAQRIFSSLPESLSRSSFETTPLISRFLKAGARVVDTRIVS